jgi:hypothetical protein
VAERLTVLCCGLPEWGEPGVDKDWNLRRKRRLLSSQFNILLWPLPFQYHTTFSTTPLFLFKETEVYYQWMDHFSRASKFREEARTQSCVGRSDSKLWPGSLSFPLYANEWFMTSRNVLVVIGEVRCSVLPELKRLTSKYIARILFIPTDRKEVYPKSFHKGSTRVQPHFRLEKGPRTPLHWLLHCHFLPSFCTK